MAQDKLLFLFHPDVTKGFEELNNQVEIVTLPNGVTFSLELLHSLPKDISILATDFTLPISKEVIDYFPKLKLISNYGVGFNNIDVAYAQTKGIVVTNTPQAVVQPTAELAIALLLGLTRKITIWDSYMRRLRSSKKDSLSDGLGIDLYKKKVGIIGYGNIGRATARILKAMGTDIFYYKRNRLSIEVEREEGVTYATKEEIFSKCDIISLHTPYNAESHHLVNQKTLSMMKPTAILINTSRGKVIDEAALIEALQKGTIAGAALDVYEHDDNPLDALYDMDNVVMTPHVGTQTTEARIAMAQEFSNNILGFIFQDRPIASVTL